MLGHAEFIEALRKEFPELRERLDENPELLHVQMGDFAQFTQQAIDSGDIPLARRCFLLADRFFGHADPALENALNVSFLEYLEFAGPVGARARSQMSPQLDKGWVEMREYLDKLFGRRGDWRKP